MKKLLTLLAISGLALSASAIPAKRVTQIVRQSDGTELAIQLRGDETFHYYVTTDGRPVCQNEKGDWVTDDRDVKALHRAALARRNFSRQKLGERMHKAMRAVRAPYRTGEVTTKRGLLILVNFQDKKMVNDSTKSHAIFNQELNAIGNPYGQNHGSIREYFRDQSYGQFDVEFDIAGPVTVSQKMEYYGKDLGGKSGSDIRPGEMVAEACLLVNDQVNFADYDWDGDGEVENIYVIYAGFAQSSGAPASTIWPHQWTLSDEENYGHSLSLDGVTVDTYACGSELYGTSGKKIDGVGTMCHEYSHCLGLPDFYDTAGDAIGMSYWSIMDSGCYSGDGYCPSGYTAYERWYCGWLTPVELSSITTVEGMKNIEETPEAYVIYNENSMEEYYLLANHQLTGWDEAAYGHGMMVLHVDYSKSAWENNTVNNTASRQRMTIIPADNKFTTSNKELAGDLWPGSKNNTALTDETTPAATLNRANTDGKKLMHKPITDIKEENGLISFSFMQRVVKIDAPVLEDAFTNVDTTSFTATWSKVPEAVCYNLYLTEEVDNGEEETIFDALNLFEDFEYFFVEDEEATSDGSTDISGSLDDYTHDPGWSGSKIYQGIYGAKLGTAKAAGVITTPLIKGTTGTMTLFLNAYDWFNYNTYASSGIYSADGTTLTVSILNAEGQELEKVEVTPNDLASEDYYLCVLNFDVPKEYKVSVATNGAKKRAYIDYLLTFDGTFSGEDVLSLFEDEEDGDEGDYVKAAAAPKAQIRSRHLQMQTAARCLMRSRSKQTTAIREVTANTYTFTNLIPGAKYTLQVEAVTKDNDTSAKSNAVSVTLPNGFYDVVSAVKPAAQPLQSTFDLMGRSVAAPLRRGLYIINGKKVYIK